MTSISYTENGTIERVARAATKSISDAVQDYQNDKIQYLEFIATLEVVSKELFHECQIDFNIFLSGDY